jgi:hypothetical protein
MVGLLESEQARIFHVFYILVSLVYYTLYNVSNGSRSQSRPPAQAEAKLSWALTLARALILLSSHVLQELACVIAQHYVANQLHTHLSTL